MTRRPTGGVQLIGPNGESANSFIDLAALEHEITNGEYTRVPT